MGPLGTHKKLDWSFDTIFVEELQKKRRIEHTRKPTYPSR